MRDADAAVATLERLRSLGMHIAVDDFGTGYSSLSYLKHFPVDTLKIDHSFVDGLGQDPQDTAIVRSTIVLARSLGLTVTAEGVETMTQQMQLRALGCERGQGYLYAGPISPSEIASLLAAADQQLEVARAA